MRSLLLFFACAVLVVSRLSAAEPVRAPDANAASATNAVAVTNLIIFCTNGAELYQQLGKVIYHDRVQVLETRMYLECELLTAYSETNSPATNQAPRDRSLTNINARVSMIVAETNLLIMIRDATIIGDRAVYTASNDVVSVTGDPVVIETDRSCTICTNFVVNRTSGEGYAIGDVLQTFLGPPVGGKDAGAALGLPRARRNPSTPSPPATPPKKEDKP